MKDYTLEQIKKEINEHIDIIHRIAKKQENTGKISININYYKGNVSGNYNIGFIKSQKIDK